MMALKKKKEIDVRNRLSLVSQPEKFISTVILPSIITTCTSGQTVYHSSFGKNRAVLNPFYNPLNKELLASYLINGDFAKGGQMGKIPIVLIKKEITAKLLNNKRQEASDGPARRLLVLTVEPE